MTVVPYSPKYKKDFIEMNKAWISAMFAIEDEDIRELDGLDPYISRAGRYFSRSTARAPSWLAA